MHLKNHITEWIWRADHFVTWFFCLYVSAHSDCSMIFVIWFFISQNNGNLRLVLSALQIHSKMWCDLCDVTISLHTTHTPFTQRTTHTTHYTHNTCLLDRRQFVTRFISSQLFALRALSHHTTHSTYYIAQHTSRTTRNTTHAKHLLVRLTTICDLFHRLLTFICNITWHNTKHTIPHNIHHAPHNT